LPPAADDQLPHAAGCTGTEGQSTRVSGPALSHGDRVNSRTLLRVQRSAALALMTGQIWWGSNSQKDSLGIGKIKLNTTF